MPAQRLITQAEYIAMTDYLAQMIEVLLTAKGVEDTPATAAAYAAACRNTITAFDQPDEADITVDLLPAAISLVAAVERESEVAVLVRGLQRGHHQPPGPRPEHLAHVRRAAGASLLPPGRQHHHQPDQRLPAGHRARHRGHHRGGHLQPHQDPATKGSSTPPSTPTLSLRLRSPAEPGASRPPPSPSWGSTSPGRRSPPR